MQTTVAIQRADAGDGETLAGVIATAFFDLAVSRWLIPDPAQRARAFPDHFRVFVDQGLRHGQVYTSSGYESVAVWLPVTDQLPPLPDDYDEQLSRVCGDNADRFRTLDQTMEHNHPTRPHEYLALLAVRPKQQNRGLGTALLRAHHRYLDEHGIGAYVEASNPRSRALYLREGYATYSEPLVFADGARPEDGPAMWPLWRDPLPPD